MTERTRLSPATFDIPIHKIRRGYYTAVYFWREKQILERMGYDKRVLMQTFQKNQAVLCGIDEAIAILKLCSGCYDLHATLSMNHVHKLFDEYLDVCRALRMVALDPNPYDKNHFAARKNAIEQELDELWENKWEDLAVQALHDGDLINPWETVMTIEGLPQHFAHLESVYLGILARRTLIATNVQRVVEAAEGKPILFFADRFDHFENQTGDGYAAMVGGAHGVATDTMGEWWGKSGSGTMPHALIACFGGNTAEATLAFAKNYPDVPVISLVDFRNDSVGTALEVADVMKAEGLKLWGVRLDTSESMVDESLSDYGHQGVRNLKGVNPSLVRLVRAALNGHGHREVRIVVSGGFDVEKIEYFEKEMVPTDAYGCGSSLLKGSNDFTADIVLVDGEDCAKTGRVYRPNDRLIKVE